MTSASPIQIFLRCTLAVFHYSTCFLGLYRIWFNAYQLIPDAHDFDLATAPTSYRSYWTETVQKMKMVWTLIFMICSLVIS